MPKLSLTERMKFLGRAFRYSLSDLDKVMDEAVWGHQALSGVSVNENTAMRHTTVYSCVRLLAETVASLPLPVYKRLQPRGKERATNHYIYPLLHDAPNPEMSAFSFREALQGHLGLWGNGYAEIEYNLDTGRPIALWPLRPDRMKKRRINGQIRYFYKLPDKFDQREVVLAPWQVLHIPAFSFDGLIGYSPITLAREAIGLSIAAEEFGERFFNQGATLSGVLEHPLRLTENALANLQKSWDEQHTGLSKAHRIAILEEGMKFHQIGIPPNDAQWLETRKFQKAEIASFFHVPPHMIGDLERATFSNIEQQSLEFVIYTMRPWLVRWEQAINRNLFTEADSRYFAEFLLTGLLRGDTESRFRAYAIARQWGWMSADDVRELENLNPLPDGTGDIYLIPMNMIPVTASEAEGEPAAKEPLALTEGTDSVRLLEGGYLTEQRNKRKALNRHRIAQSYRGVFTDAIQRIVERERTNVIRNSKKHLAERSIDAWLEWLKDFYRDFPAYIKRQIEPALHGLAEAIQFAAAEEVHLPLDPKAGITTELQHFLNEYAETFSIRYADSSQGQLNALVRDAIVSGEDPMDALSERVDGWTDTRANNASMNEVTQLSNVVAKIMFASAGVTKLVWVSVGGDSCPFCDEMNGKVVGIEQEFVPAGTSLEAEGKNTGMTVYRPTAHPPLHLGCVCQIIPA